MLTTLAAWPPVAESRCASPATISLIVPRPSTRPPGDFPQPPARRLPRHGALGRAPEPIRRRQSTANTEAPFRCASRIFCESQAAKPQNKSKPCPSLTRPPPSLGSPCPSRFPSRYRTQQAVPFSLSRRDFTSTVQGLLARSSLRSTLSRFGFISLGKTKKYSEDMGLFLCHRSTVQSRSMLAVYITSKPAT